MNTYNTSLNQVPGIVKTYKNELDNKTVLNFGSGKGWKKTEDFLNKSTVYHYDINDPKFNELPLKKFDKVICANVLNVIDTAYEIQQVVNRCITLTSTSGQIYFSIYQGDKSGVGSATAKGYQRNEKTIAYEKYFKNIIRKNNYLIYTKS